MLRVAVSSTPLLLFTSSAEPQKAFAGKTVSLNVAGRWQTALFVSCCARPLTQLIALTQVQVAVKKLKSSQLAFDDLASRDFVLEGELRGVTAVQFADERKRSIYGVVLTADAGAGTCMRSLRHPNVIKFFGAGYETIPADDPDDVLTPLVSRFSLRVDLLRR